jgi:hypothetical protein
LVLIGGCLYYESRRPHFSGTSPSAIDVHIGGYHASTNDYHMSITNRTACETLLREFRQARPYVDQSKAVGKFTFHYDSGKTDVVWMISGSHGYHSIFFVRPSWGPNSFHMRNERFYQVLKGAGVDVSKIP